MYHLLQSPQNTIIDAFVPGILPWATSEKCVACHSYRLRSHICRASISLSLDWSSAISSSALRSWRPPCRPFRRNITQSVCFDFTNLRGLQLNSLNQLWPPWRAVSPRNLHTLARGRLLGAIGRERCNRGWSWSERRQNKWNGLVGHYFVSDCRLNPGICLHTSTA